MIPGPNCAPPGGCTSLIAALWVFVLPASVPLAQDALPANVQAVLLLRVLGYDQRIDRHTGAKGVRIAVVHKDTNQAAKESGREMVSALERASYRQRVAGHNVDVIAIGYRDPTQFAAEVAALRPTALYVCAGLEADLAQIVSTSRAFSVLSFGSRPEDVRGGLSVAFTVRTSRPAMVASPTHARAEGATLDADLLALAELIDEAELP